MKRSAGLKNLGRGSYFLASQKKCSRKRTLGPRMDLGWIQLEMEGQQILRTAKKKNKKERCSRCEVYPVDAGR